jgi:drug/metabolite transporter (DMT)-like permease
MSQRLRSDLILLLTAVIWGSAFVAQRVAAEYIGVFLFNGLRFLLGAALLLPFADLRHNLNRRTILGPTLAGVVLFTASALQQAGLEFTTAGNAGFITSMYVVLVPLLLVIFFRQPVRWLVWVAVGLAMVGALLLSTGGQSFRLAPGDGLELIGAGVWALHVIVVDRFAKQVKALAFAVGQFIVAAILNLIVGLIFEGNTLPGVAHAWWTVAYIAVFSTAIGYTLQIVGQRHAPPTDAALIMSLESVFAAIFGALLLAEGLNPVQIIGCGLILSGVVLAQIRPAQIRPVEIPPVTAVTALVGVEVMPDEEG